MTQQLIVGFIRHGLQCAGGALATKGVIEADQVESVVGIGLSVVAYAWSAWRKWKREQKEKGKAP